MSWRYQLRKRTKTLNNDIMTKTQIALQAIKNYQAKQSIFGLQRNKNQILLNQYNAINEINQDYKKMHEHKELKIDKPYKIQIFPYNEQYYYINTQYLIFPVRIFIRNVKNQGIIYVGYDKEYPGVQGTSKEKNGESEETDKPSFDYKFNFNKDILCILKNQKKKMVKRIYLTIVAQKQLLMFNLRVDYIGYEYMESEEPVKIQRNRAYTVEQNTNKSIIELQMISPAKKTTQSLFQNIFLSRQKKSYTNLKRSKTESEEQFIFQTPQRLLYKNITNPTLEIKKKNFVKINLNDVSLHKKQTSKQAIQQKKQKKLESIERTKANREQLEQHKQKQKQLKDTASKLKRSIEAYQKLYKEQKIKDKKFIKLVAPLIYVNIFVQRSNRAYNKEQNSKAKRFKSQAIAIQFTKQLRKKYIETHSQIGDFKVRNQMSCLHIFQLAAKLVLPGCKKNAGSLIFSAFQNLQPALILNHSLNQATKYRQAVRLVQKAWITKYKARCEMLQYFSYRHIEGMLKEFPHLRMGFNTFKAGNYCYKICYEYMIDQSVKFKNIYEAYLKRIEEIQEFIKINYQVRQYNKGKPQSKWKKYLDIPKKPTPPQQRIFRNLDILKSMIRGWFEIEYKKILKRSIYGK